MAELSDADRAGQHLAAIIESSDDAIISKDLDGIVTSWNRSAENMFGYSADDMIGRSIRTIIPADRQAEEETVLSSIRRGVAVEHFDTVRQRKDGTLLPISLTVSPIRDRDGTVIGASKIARDISDRKLAEAERAWLLSRAQEASHLKDEFLATLSHELRTPLNAILGYASMLKRQQMEGERRDRAIEAIERNASSLAQLVEDVLDVSRITAGKIRLNLQPVDLAAIVRTAIDTALPAAEVKEIRIETRLDGDATGVVGDPDRLQQVLWNLLSNAVKFTGRGGLVQVGLDRVDSDVEISVRDTGAGIDPAFLPHLFSRFRQADSGPTREQGGLGLGLAIARHLVEMHGGTIHGSSAGAGQGATFRVRLPVAQTGSPAA